MDPALDDSARQLASGLDIVTHGACADGVGYLSLLQDTPLNWQLLQQLRQPPRTAGQLRRFSTARHLDPMTVEKDIQLQRPSKTTMVPETRQNLPAKVLIRGQAA